MDLVRDEMLKEKQKNGTITSAESKEIVDDERYWQTLVVNQEVPGCCGGKTPSVQPFNCNGFLGEWAIEWCCCCDLFCGCCECCNPCCRRNMFDYERKRGMHPGYSLLQSRLLQLVFVAMFLCAFVAYGIGLAGLREFNCATKSLLPSLLDTSELMIRDLTPMMMAVESTVAALSDIQQVL